MYAITSVHSDNNTDSCHTLLWCYGAHTDETVDLDHFYLIISLRHSENRPRIPLIYVNAITLKL